MQDLLHSHSEDTVVKEAEVSTEVTEKVKQALESPNYVWRTIGGLTKDTQLPEETVASVLSSLPDDVLATTVSKQGPLYTTRKHYKEKQSFLGRFLSAASGTLK